MLMAAGLGTRLRPFTDRYSKPMLPLLGSPMAAFAYDAVRAAGVEKVVANVHHLAAATEAGLFALREPGGPRIEISDESSLLLGSAGGLRQAAPKLGGPFFLVNGDVLCS